MAQPEFQADIDPLKAIVEEIEERRMRMIWAREELLRVAADTTAHPSAIRKRLREIADQLVTTGPPVVGGR